ncbi:MAG: DUF669 domain-containing protein, partial [Betaproteobacteria bacterium]
MALLPQYFDPATAPGASTSLVPAGRYNVQIVSSDLLPTKEGSGQYILFEMLVLDGPQQGRKVFDRLNIVNRSPQAVEMANRTLASICRATGRAGVGETSELHNIPFILDVGIKSQGGFGETNTLRYFARSAPVVPRSLMVQQVAAPLSASHASVPQEVLAAGAQVLVAGAQASASHAAAAQAAASQAHQPQSANAMPWKITA